MSVVATVIKDPQARLDYGLEWDDWLAPVSDTLSASPWSLPDDHDDLTIVSQPFTTLVASVWLTGGQVGCDYIITNHIVTAAGREDDRSIKIKVRQR